jgi:hypothetical protein
MDQDKPIQGPGSHSGATTPTQSFGGGEYGGVRSGQQFGSGSQHVRMPSASDDAAREEGMENDEGGGWEALRQAQRENRDYRLGGGSGGPDDDIGFDDEGTGMNSLHQRR